MFVIVKYIIRDIIRSKFLLFYTISLFCITVGIVYLNRNDTKTYITVLNVVIYLIPLINMLYSSLHYYNSKEFIETILTYPIKRSQVFWSEYISLFISLVLSFIIGVILPLLIFSFSIFVIYFLISGLILISIFTSISLLFSIIFDEKLKGVGIQIGIWLFMAIAYDGIILLMYLLLNDFPLDKISIFLIAFNPIDLIRLFMLINFDISALFGYSGANFQKFFGNFFGIMISLLISIVWSIVPLFIAKYKFSKKDF